MGVSSMVSTLKAYFVPLFFLSLAIYYQLFVIPSSFPPSHYDVLGIKSYSTIEVVTEAYEKLTSKWNSGMEVPATIDFIKVQYAYELLTNPLWKRDYDKFGIDEQLHIFEKFKQQSIEERFSEINIPLLNASSSTSSDHAFNVIKSSDYQYTIGNNLAWLIQVYSSGSNRCRQFLTTGKELEKIFRDAMYGFGDPAAIRARTTCEPTSLLDGAASTGMVELGEVKLAAYLSEKKLTGQPFFRKGLPSLVAFPPGCSTSDCLFRYQGELSVDAVSDWFATTILGLPRILYYSKDSLGPNFLAKSGHHKVKVIFFSKTGERAAPFVRQAAKNYWAYASFAFVLWREEESSIWWNTFEVESAPAIVFLKEPGVKPVVHHGTFNSSWFLNQMEENKQQELPQLRSVTSMELGCDARGYSRAGNDTMTWYCVILAGRQSLELNNMRETMRRVRGILSNDDNSDAAGKYRASEPAAETYKNRRLTFTWLDGEAQQKYCFFYLHSENSYESCGPRRDLNDVPQLFMVRYKRNSTEDSQTVERKPKTIWDTFQDDDVDPASQLVARYNGTGESPKIIEWISQIIKDGDSRELPFFRTKTPDLVPEDVDPFWSRGTQSVLSTSKGIKQRIFNFVTSACDQMGDPRLGPILLLAASISFGTIWLQRSQTSKSSQSNEQSQQSTEGNANTNRRNRTRTRSSQDRPPSITDIEPEDAYQLLQSNSDSE